MWVRMGVSLVFASLISLFQREVCVLLIGGCSSLIADCRVGICVRCQACLFSGMDNVASFFFVAVDVM
jgi:hypothetical protein